MLSVSLTQNASPFQVIFMYNHQQMPMQSKVLPVTHNTARILPRPGLENLKEQFLTTFVRTGYDPAAGQGAAAGAAQGPMLRAAASTCPGSGSGSLPLSPPTVLTVLISSKGSVCVCAGDDVGELRTARPHDLPHARSGPPSPFSAPDLSPSLSPSPSPSRKLSLSLSLDSEAEAGPEPGF